MPFMAHGPQLKKTKQNITLIKMGLLNVPPSFPQR